MSRNWSDEYLKICEQSIQTRRLKDSQIQLVIPFDASTVVNNPDLILLFIDLQNKLAWAPDRSVPQHTHLLVRSHESLPDTIKALKTLKKFPNGPIYIHPSNMPALENPLGNPIQLKDYPIFESTLSHYLASMEW